MQAIYTKYLGPTDYKQSRLKAYTLDGKSVTIPYPGGWPDEKIHFEAVKALAARYGIAGVTAGMVYGDAPGGYVFCYPNSTVK